MAHAEETEMSDGEIDEFLARHETGVLALAQSDEPYSIPISYGFDAGERTFYMRLVSTPESQKRRFLAASPSARLVVYEEADERTTYRSVVATGDLEEIPPEELTPDQIAQYGSAKRPLFEIWAESKPDLEISLYRLSPKSVSGRATEIEYENEDEE